MANKMDHSPDIPRPDKAIKIAVIGAGSRSRRHYTPLFSSLTPWIDVVAVCDPVKENSDAMAQALNARAYTDIRELVKDKPMEAALVIAPIALHHSISVYLSSHGIHNLTETTWCSMVAQARQMIDTARDNNVVVRVAENFFRFAIDRIVQKLKSTSFIGDIHRIVSYNDHTGYHNNSRWIAIAGAHPTSVQSIEHTMPTSELRHGAGRPFSKETYRARFFAFPGNLLVMDHASNIKGRLGRHSRPGYTEWQGTRGTIVHSPKGHGEMLSEVRYCSDEGLAKGRVTHDQTFPIIDGFDEKSRWICTYVDLPIGHVEYLNPYRLIEQNPHSYVSYGSAITDHIVDFALAVRGLRDSEFDEQDAMMSLMMEVGARESALKDGKRISLPLKGESEMDHTIREDLKKQLGVDPMDVEAMLSVTSLKP